MHKQKNIQKRNCRLSEFPLSAGFLAPPDRRCYGLRPGSLWDEHEICSHTLCIYVYVCQRGGWRACAWPLCVTVYAISLFVCVCVWERDPTSNPYWMCIKTLPIVKPQRWRPNPNIQLSITLSHQARSWPGSRKRPRCPWTDRTVLPWREPCL